MKMFLALYAYALFTVHFAFAEVEKKVFEAKGVKVLDFENDTGKVEVKAENTPSFTVTTNKRAFDHHCSLKMEIKDDRLVISAGKVATASHASCIVDFKISGPVVLDADFKIGTGDINATGLKGRISFKVGSGEITTNSLLGDLHGQVGNGSVNGQALAGDVDIKIGNGTSELAFAASDRKARKISVKTGNGGVSLQLPSKASVEAEFKSGLGKMINEFSTPAGNPDFKVSVKTGNGNLKISKS